MNKTIVITGTHITPALALIEKLKASSYKIHYLGKDNSFDQQLIIKAGYHFTAIKTPKFKRHQVLLSILKSSLLIPSLLKSIKTLRDIKPETVISFGGFVALPVCLAAKLLKIKLVIHEQTLKVGLTNKLTTPLADKVAISWPQSQKYFPKNKTTLTGNPVRSKLLKIFPSKTKTKTIYITGGSQGSLAINQATSKILKQLLDSYNVFHQFGLAQDQATWQQALDFKNKLPKNLKDKYTLKQWFTEKELGSIFKKSDLIISRSGINIVTEILLLKTRSILIPLLYTQKNEQLNNANYLKDQGLATILPQKNLNPENLLEAISKAYKTLPKKPINKIDYNLIKNATTNLFNLVK